MLTQERCQQGVTIIELMITVAILGILVALAAPYMGSYVERQRWVGATEALYGQLQQAKRAALSNNTQIYFKVSSAASANWCVGYGDASTCDCGSADPATVCEINGQETLSVRATDYPGISLYLLDGGGNKQADTSISGSFTMPGASADPKTLEITSDSLGDIDVKISSTGRVRVCSDDLSQYPDC